MTHEALDLRPDGSAGGAHHRSVTELGVRGGVALVLAVTVPYAAVAGVDRLGSVIPPSWAWAAGWAAALLLELYLVHVMLDSITETRERRIVETAERNLWDVFEREVYNGAELVEIRSGRRVCVLHRPSRLGAAAPVVFLVHGSMARLSQFSHQLEYLHDQGYTVVAYDYYGCGRSHKPRASPSSPHYSTPAHMEDLLAVYRRFANPDTANIVVGHSFGASQVLRLALQAAADADSSLPSPSGLVQAAKLFRLPLWALRLLHPVLSAGFKKRALHPDTLTSSQPHAQQLMRVATAANGANPFHVVKPFYVESEDLPPHTVVGKVTQPVLLINGEADRLLPPSAARHLRDTALPHGEVHVVPGASHQVMQEQPHVVNELLVAFVRRVSPATSD